MFARRFKRHVSPSTQSTPVFVIGTGRSGTHWLGYSLGDHAEITSTIESQPMFGLSTNIALYPNKEWRLYPQLRRAYRDIIQNCETRLYVDKSHPNIWIAEKLRNSFPSALFVGIERNPYATIASMLRHPNVRDWHRRWREFPIPNRFLGISTPSDAKIYDDLPIESQCAMRWQAHRQELERLRSTIGPALKVIRYEEFSERPEDTVAELSEFLNLESKLRTPEVKYESLTKWQTQLSKSMCQNIEEIVDLPASDVAWANLLSAK